MPPVKRAPYTLWPLSVDGAADALTPLSGWCAAPPGGASSRSLPFGLWSKILRTMQWPHCPLQKASCASVSAIPLELTVMVFVERRSSSRYTVYSGAPIGVVAYSARAIECAATHGVPAAARMSHGAVEAAKPRA